MFVATVVLAASCGGGGAVPPAEGVLPEAPPVSPPLEVLAPPPPTTGTSVETTVSVGATVATGSAATTTTSTTTTTTSTATTVASTTSTTVLTTTTTVTTASVPDSVKSYVSRGGIVEYYVLEDGTRVPPEEYVEPTLPVPVLPDSASEFRGHDLGSGFNYSCGLRSSDNSAACWYWEEPYRYREYYDYEYREYYDYEGDFYDGWGAPSVETPEGGFAAVDAGREAACGLRPTGEVECWGANPLAEVPPPEGEFVSVSVGLEHACAIRSSGEVECWGTSPVRGGLLSLVPDGPFTSITGGPDTSGRPGSMCGLRPSGEVECWGSGYGEGGLSPPQGVFKAISGASGDTCGLRPGGSVECWGDYDLTDEAVTAVVTSYLLPPSGEFESVFVGHGIYACGLKADQAAECWSHEFRRGNVEVGGPPEGEEYLHLAVGWDSACGVRVDNTLGCWHQDSEKNSDSDNREGRFTEFVFGPSGHHCGLRLDGTVECSLRYSYRVCDNSGCREERQEGWLPDPGGVFTSVSPGADHVCGLRATGEAECWGSDRFGKASPPEGIFTQVVASVDFSCGLRPTGEIECWGGGKEAKHSKVVAPRERLVFVDAGWGGNDGPWPFEDWDMNNYPGLSGWHDWGYSCGLREDGSLLCWGNGSRLGGNDLHYGEGPILSPPEGVFVDVGVGKHQACALRNNFRAECWGLYGNYVYGEKSGQSHRFVSLEVGGWFACGLLSGGQIRCWNLRTQAPVLPPWVDSYGSERTYSLISAGYFHVCGYRKHGSLEMSFNIPGSDCWGPPITRDMQSP